MTVGDGTQFDRPIPLRDKGSEPPEEERPNPWSRLEAVSSVRERLGWLAEHLIGEWEVVAGADVGQVIDQLADELHTALWGPLGAVDRVRHRVPQRQQLATWDAKLDPSGDL
jgi:hypothetical protein